MSDERDCVVKLVDDHGVEHSVKVRAASVYEAALKGLNRLNKVGWESDGSQIGSVLVEVYEEPTRHRVNVAKMLRWLKEPGRLPRDNADRLPFTFIDLLQVLLPQPT
jgi:hypothetical protein